MDDHMKDPALERLRLLLDIEDRARQHGPLYSEIGKAINTELAQARDVFAKANAEKAELVKKAQIEADHRAAVEQNRLAEPMQDEKKDEEQRSALRRPTYGQSLIDPSAAPPLRTPPIYPPETGIIENDTTRRI